MKFIFNQEIYGVNSVQLSGYTEEQQHVLIPMLYKDRKWECDYEVTDRTFRYRYLVNGDIIKLNDPNASYYLIDCFSEVWSIYDCEVNSNEECSEYEYPLTNGIYIEKSTISDRILNNFNRIKTKKVLNMKNDIKVAVCLDIRRIVGTHVVTVIWHQPDGRIFRVEDRTLDVPLENGEVNANVYFWLDFEDVRPSFAKGIWVIDVYLDGKKVLRDNFILVEGITEQYVGFQTAI
ncbi:MAG: hypothetical protein IJD58_00100 [Lachnospiraceae bacterium]|nr:hypothetical protein [Lachnospiraceae bacterium]